MIHDAHLHLCDHRLLEEMIRHDVVGIGNATTPQEYEQLLQYQKEWSQLSISSGIHPWNVDQITWDSMLPMMEQTNFIGEIGLDNVWCNTSIELQVSIFEQSLAFASQRKKPVILHIKGMEKEALPYIKRYTNTYLVHWYSCLEYLEDYIELGCYFTVGPSINVDEAVMQVAKQVPLNRLLLESDGIEAIRWCEDRPVNISEYAGILHRSLHAIATLKDCNQEALLQHMNRNYVEFIHIADLMNYNR